MNNCKWLAVMTVCALVCCDKKGRESEGTPTAVRPTAASAAATITPPTQDPYDPGRITWQGLRLGMEVSEFRQFVQAATNAPTRKLESGGNQEFDGKPFNSLTLINLESKLVEKFSNDSPLKALPTETRVSLPKPSETWEIDYQRTGMIKEISGVFVDGKLLFAEVSLSPEPVTFREALEKLRAKHGQPMGEATIKSAYWEGFEPAYTSYQATFWKKGQCSLVAYCSERFGEKDPYTIILQDEKRIRGLIQEGIASDKVRKMAADRQRKQESERVKF